MSSEQGTRQRCPLTVAELAALLLTSVEGDSSPAHLPLGAVHVDSREVTDGDIFFALKGAMTDGHRYIADAVQHGAAVVVADQAAVLPNTGETVVLRVDNTTNALEAAATRRLAELGTATIGITGSVGKTSAKEMLWQLLVPHLAVQKSAENFNTNTGLARSVLSLEAPCRYYVAELGMSDHGEIAHLCEIVRPEMGVLLNVGYAHIEFLHTQAAIADAKGELLAALPAGGAAFCNLDDPLVVGQAKRSAAPVVWFSTTQHAQSAASQIERTARATYHFLLTVGGSQAEVEMTIPGQHLIATACATAAVAARLGIGIDEIAFHLGEFRVPSQRGTMITLPDDITLIDDAYNSSPTSLHAALVALRETGAHSRVAVIGDMLELGEWAERLHVEAGAIVAQTATELVAVGSFGPALARGAIEAGMDVGKIHVCRDVAGAGVIVASLMAPHAAILVKGSHGVHLERLVDLLQQRDAPHDVGGAPDVD